ncbi:Spermidine/spermine N(1)-acetyltransferase [Polaribacter huanghezhanensis]|uniref:GNAT family N-acetyltransferase n=1 Tax=Polaribacter huanghezhanensis TaxID=1354726 RepID=UPI002648EDA1|nr:GNAT family N-acetyltransferase [Polaribacter huanghezhanensis]WKD84775.1 Spermidine/spermine N(1)-acetyltransferase [Polaribacter huanghezhanensis]
MHNITKAKLTDAKILAQLAKETFLPAHGHSASKEDVDMYVSENFNETTFIKELSNPENHYYLMYHNNTLAGYSKITLNTPNKNISSNTVTCLSRLYVLKEFYGLQLGKKLFDFNIEFTKQHQQQGIWLHVWIENQRAINFYTKMGFTIVGTYDFKISATHTNPNYVMYLHF